MRRRCVLFATLHAMLISVAAHGQSVNDGYGKEWRQLTETTIVSWNQAAQVCPRDGVSACSGVAGAKDLTGWVWATREQVIELFGYYEPAILASPTSSISGQQYFFTASGFLSAIRPTFSFAITYQSGQFAAGWTASTDAAGLPLAGSVGVGTTPVSISGSFSVGPVNNPSEVRADRGVFLWRSTGLGGAVIANDDSGSVPSPAGGTAVANVLANDWLGGVRATTATSIANQQSSTNAGIALDPADGSVDVAAGTPVGTHTLVYQICEIANSSNCDPATVTVIVKALVVNAVNDYARASSKTPGTAIVSVLANDWLGSMRATTANVRLSLLSLSPPTTGIVLDLSDGSVDVTKKVNSVTYTLVYQICETASPANCDQATVTLELSGGGD